jgi:hypothetical protein
MSAELSLVATWAPIVISLVSLILTGFFSIRSYRLDKSDKEQSEELRRIQKQLSEFQLQKAQEDAAAKTSSKVEARHVPIGLKEHHIRIANVGGTVATDVTTTCDDGPYSYSRDKEPFERLEPGESFDQAVFFADRSPSKFTITTHWRDADGGEHSRDNIITW